MQAEIAHKGKVYHANLSRPIDISLPVTRDPRSTRAWYVDAAIIEPVQSEHFVGDVNLGGSVNFRNVFFNPHAHGTHTENVGHISKEFYSIARTMDRYFFIASVVSVTPKINGDDRIITAEGLLPGLLPETEAIIIRTRPNSDEKKHINYSGKNAPYLSLDAIDLLLSRGIDHILIDTPSVDRELDEGKLAAHHAFWEYPQNPQLHRTITELIYVQDAVPDGLYLLCLQPAAMENDAAPCRVVIYAVMNS